MKDLPDYFEPVIELITSYIETREDHWTLQAHGGHYTSGPYVQALLEHDNMILIEAVSNKFLKPELPEEGHTTLLFMGWRFYPGDHYPNYAQMLDLGKFTSREIAIKMAEALHFAYGVDENYAFNMCPQIEAAKKIIFNQVRN
jgi:hypothetical protein